MSNRNIVGRSALHDPKGELQNAINQSRKTENDLSRRWESSMAQGLLYPYIIDAGTNTDEYDIDVETLVETMPTVGPLHGNFDMNIDFFRIKARHYNPLLHNVPWDVAREATEIRLPYTSISVINPMRKSRNLSRQQVSPNSLLRYLGTAGFGLSQQIEPGSILNVDYELSCMIGYFETVRNYYADKQDGKMYVVGARPESKQATITKVVIDWPGLNRRNGEKWEDAAYREDGQWKLLLPPGATIRVEGSALNEFSLMSRYDTGNFWTANKDAMYADLKADGKSITFTTKELATGSYRVLLSSDMETQNDTTPKWQTFFDPSGYESLTNDKLELIEYDTKSIDKLRMELMKRTGIGDNMYVGEDVFETIEHPIKEAIGVVKVPRWGRENLSDPDANASACYYDMAGLAVKMYKGDRFNSWLNPARIARGNGQDQESLGNLANITVDSMGVDFNEIIMSKATYDLVNRIIMGGDTWADWQRAHYGTSGGVGTEIPEFCGGVRLSINFQEIHSTAESGESPLGSLAGRGYDSKIKNKKIHIECQEQEFIMAIISITPNIAYGQGNRHYTRWKSPADWHSPKYDNIEWQDKLTDEMYAMDTVINTDGTVSYNSVGKEVAWMEQTTAFDEVFGDFAPGESLNYMALTMNYEPDVDEETGQYRGFDHTKYIHPYKHNYAFAQIGLEARPFWTQIKFNISSKKQIAKRLMPMLG